MAGVMYGPPARLSEDGKAISRHGHPCTTDPLGYGYCLGDYLVQIERDMVHC